MTKRDFLIILLDVRVSDMLHFYDSGSPEEYAQTREEVERLCAFLDGEDEVCAAKDVLKSL